MIYAVSPEGVIGRDGRIPWHYPADLKRFKRLTSGGTIVMGRATFDSIGRALPGRRNIVVTSRPLATAGVERAASVEDALALAGDADVWFIGGARIYEAAMAYVETIDVTYVPDHVDPAGAVLAPQIEPNVFDAGAVVVHEDDARLTRRVYTRRG